MFGMNLLHTLNEMINDTSLFKAVILGGLPGAGKSTIINKVVDASVGARVINPDKFAERGIEPTKVKHLTMEQIYHYVNGMLPLIVDTTSMDIDRTVARSNALSTLGYDVMVIWVNTDLEKAKERAAKRQRVVPPDIIEKAHRMQNTSREYLKVMFPNYLEIENNGDPDLGPAISALRSFFSSEVKNPVGRKTLKMLKQAGGGYLVPSTFTEANLRSMVTNWYRGHETN